MLKYILYLIRPSVLNLIIEDVSKYITIIRQMLKEFMLLEMLLKELCLLIRQKKKELQSLKS
jgi:hypothetical protein